LNKAHRRILILALSGGAVVAAACKPAFQLVFATIVNYDTTKCAVDRKTVQPNPVSVKRNGIIVWFVTNTCTNASYDTAEIYAANANLFDAKCVRITSTIDSGKHALIGCRIPASPSPSPYPYDIRTSTSGSIGIRGEPEIQVLP